MLCACLIAKGCAAQDASCLLAACDAASQARAQSLVANQLLAQGQLADLAGGGVRDLCMPAGRRSRLVQTLC